MAEDSQVKIVKTDILKVEIFDMPVIDLSRRFCYRFVEPIPMIWQTDGRCSISFQLTMIGGDTYEKIIGDFLLKQYREVIENSERQGLWSPELEWLKDVKAVEVIQCDLVVRETFKVTQESIDEEIKQKVQGR